MRFSKNRRRPFPARSVLAAVFAVLAIAAAFIWFRYTSRKTAAEKTEQASSLRYGYSTEPVTLDPLSPFNTADGNSILFNVFEGLVRPDTEGVMRPALAETVTVNESGTVYDFTLRKNVRFHDNSLLTSADVKFSLETAAASGGVGLSAVKTIETNGDYNIRVTLKESDFEFLPCLVTGIVKANSVDRDKTAVGTGPYRIDHFYVQQELVLKKFDNYRDKNIPRLETITIVFFADSEAMLLGLQAGTIDGAGITGSMASQLDSGRFDLIPGPSAMVHLLALNNAAPPFNDLRVREAINYGIDIREIIDMAFYGKGEPSGSPVIPGLPAYYNSELADPYPYNPEKAAALLADAGYGGEKKLSFEITVPSNYAMHVDTAQVIAARLAAIGVDVTIKLIDWAGWLSDVYRGRKYQATVISLDSPIVSPAGFLSRYRSGDDNNFINFNSDTFNQVYGSIPAESDPNKRADLYREAQRIISDNAASVYIQDILGFKAFRSGAYGGVLNYPLFVIDFASMYAK